MSGGGHVKGSSSVQMRKEYFEKMFRENGGNMRVPSLPPEVPPRPNSPLFRERSSHHLLRTFERDCREEKIDIPKTPPPRQARRVKKNHYSGGDKSGIFGFPMMSDLQKFAVTSAPDSLKSSQSDLQITDSKVTSPKHPKSQPSACKPSRPKPPPPPRPQVPLISPKTNPPPIPTTKPPSGKPTIPKIPPKPPSPNINPKRRPRPPPPPAHRVPPLPPKRERGPSSPPDVRTKMRSGFPLIKRSQTISVNQATSHDEKTTLDQRALPPKPKRSVPPPPSLPRRPTILASNAKARTRVKKAPPIPPRKSASVPPPRMPRSSNPPPSPNRKSPAFPRVTSTPNPSSHSREISPRSRPPHPRSPRGHSPRPRPPHPRSPRKSSNAKTMGTPMKPSTRIEKPNTVSRVLSHILTSQKSSSSPSMKPPTRSAPAMEPMTPPSRRFRNRAISTPFQRSVDKPKVPSRSGREKLARVMRQLTMRKEFKSESPPPPLSVSPEPRPRNSRKPLADQDLHDVVPPAPRSSVSSRRQSLATLSLISPAMKRSSVGNITPNASTSRTPDGRTRARNVRMRSNSSPTTPDHTRKSLGSSKSSFVIPEEDEEQVAKSDSAITSLNEKAASILGLDRRGSIEAASVLGLDSRASIDSSASGDQLPKRKSLRQVGGRSRMKASSAEIRKSMTSIMPAQAGISFILMKEETGWIEEITDVILYTDWEEHARVMRCRFKQTVVISRKKGETLFDVQHLVDANGELDGVLEEWQYIDWNGKHCLLHYDGKQFMSREEGEKKNRPVPEIRFLSHKLCKWVIKPSEKQTAPISISNSSLGKNTIEMKTKTARLPRYTFRETAMQIEKDRAIFAKMGVDSTHLALDGLLKAELGEAAADSKGPASDTHDVTKEVEGIVSAGTLQIDEKIDVGTVLGVSEKFPNQGDHYLFLQFRVAGEPKELRIPRITDKKYKAFVGLKKLVPVVRLTCADLVDRLIEVPSSLFMENFLLTLPYHAEPDYVVRLLLKRTYPQIDSPWRPRIFAVLKKWAQTYPEDFGQTDLLRNLLAQAKEITDLDKHGITFHDREAERLLRALTSSLKTMRKEIETPLEFAMWPSFLADPQQYDAYAINLFKQDKDTKVVAFEMAVLAQQRLQSLSGRDFIKKGYSETRRNQMVISEHMARWVGTTVLIHREPKVCCQTVNRWLKTARECLDMNNFNSLFEIMVGLQQTPVMRIVKTEDQLDSKLLADLKHITAMDNNYKAYRTALFREKGRPCVPYFGVLLRDMLGYEEAKPKIKSKFEDGTVWVNLKKCERMGQLVSDALLFKGNRYSHRSSKKTRALIENSMRSARNEDALYELSYEIRPRGVR